MKGPIIKSLPEMIAELDEETRRTEEWRKARGIPKGSYQASSHILSDFYRPLRRGLDLTFPKGGRDDDY